MPIVTIQRHATRLDADPRVVLARVFDTPLSVEGVNLALNSKIIGAKRTFASPFLCTVHTAALCSAKHLIVDGAYVMEPGEVTIDNRFCEVWNRRVLHAPVDQVVLFNADELKQAMRLDVVLHHSAHEMPANEESRGTGGEADVRFKRAITALALENLDCDHVHVVTHGDAVGAMAGLCGKDVYEVDYCGFITAQFKDNAWTVVHKHGVGFLE
jgi:hypothetical protein